jgi:hypothetical protein
MFCRNVGMEYKKEILPVCVRTITPYTKEDVLLAAQCDAPHSPLDE